MLGLLRACHPEPALTVTVLVTALAATAGRGPLGCLLVASAVLTGQLSVGWCNDRLDRERDIAAGRADKPLATGDLAGSTVSRAAATALALCVPLSLASGALAGAAHLTGVAAAWAYNLGVKRTALSWLPYALGFGLLPAFVTLGLPGHPWPPGWIVGAGALLGVGAHLTNVLPDIEDDLRAGCAGCRTGWAGAGPAPSRPDCCSAPARPWCSARRGRSDRRAGPRSPSPAACPWRSCCRAPPVATRAAAGRSWPPSPWRRSPWPCCCCAAPGGLRSAVPPNAGQRAVNCWWTQCCHCWILLNW